MNPIDTLVSALLPFRPAPLPDGTPDDVQVIATTLDYPEPSAPLNLIVSKHITVGDFRRAEDAIASARSVLGAISETLQSACEQAELAYRYSANSYTAFALSACYQARHSLKLSLLNLDTTESPTGE